MNNKNSGAAGGGISLSGVLFIVFLILKLCNIITWSWWWVTAPLWIPVALGVVIFVIAMIIILIKDRMDRRW